MSAPFTVIEVEQRSPEWFSARAGRLTGSLVGDALALPLKSGGEAAATRNLRIRLALEQLTGRSLDRSFVTQAMQYGIDREPMARAAFEAETGEMVYEVGFLQHNALMAGASLDGFVGEFSELVSIKCPQPAAHWEFLKTGKWCREYELQMLHESWITGTLRHNFVSFNPDFSVALQLKIVPVVFTVEQVEAHEKAVRGFLAGVEKELAEMRQMEGAA